LDTRGFGSSQEARQSWDVSGSTVQFSLPAPSPLSSFLFTSIGSSNFPFTFGPRSEAGGGFCTSALCTLRNGYRGYLFEQGILGFGRSQLPITNAPLFEFRKAVELLRKQHLFPTFNSSYSDSESLLFAPVEVGGEGVV